jgi:hypothetical protein
MPENAAPSEYEISVMLRALDGTRGFQSYLEYAVRLDRRLWGETLRQHVLLTVGGLLNTDDLDSSGDKTQEGGPERKQVEEGRFGYFYPDPPRPIDRVFYWLGYVAMWMELSDAIATVDFAEFVGQGYVVRRFDYHGPSGMEPNSGKRDTLEAGFFELLEWLMVQEEWNLTDGDAKNYHPPGEAERLAVKMAEVREALTEHFTNRRVPAPPTAVARTLSSSG